MLVSAELRWFWRESLPPRLEPWFRSGAFPAGGGTPRNDEYLFDPREVELGLKKRGGSAGIEIKGLVRIGTPLSEPFPGDVQIWCKWTSQGLTIDHLPRITVRKTRWLRKYDTAGPDVREVELDAEERLRDSSEKLPEHGCHLELVALTVGENDARWWTFALEAFGPLDTVERSLQRTIAHLVRMAPPALEGGLEMSYPQWLSTLRSRS